MCTEVDGWNICGVYVDAPSRIRACIYIYVCLFVCMYVCARIHMFAYVHDFVHIHMRLFAAVATK